jgi:hypothetical protein
VWIEAHCWKWLFVLNVSDVVRRLRGAEDKTVRAAH